MSEKKQDWKLLNKMEIVESTESFEQTAITENDSFFFEYLGDKLEGQKDLKQLLEKWGLSETLHASALRFNLRFQEMSPEPFLVDLFNTSSVRSLLKEINLPSGLCSKVTYKKLKCTHTNLELFNKMDDEPDVLVASNKYIKKMLEEEVNGIMIGDKLRELLLKDDSDYYTLFSEEERSEFLFKIFQALVLGGSICQYEDYLAEYINATRQLYKSIVSARKDSQTSQIFIESQAYHITHIDGKSVHSNTSNPQNFLYVVVSPSLRQACVVSNQWKAFW